MKIIADSGSTKTDWCVTGEDGFSTKITTQGINPFHMTEERVGEILREELLPSLPTGKGDVTDIEFYGAGCTKEKIPVMEGVLRKVFPVCLNVTVDSDLLGAAKALCGNEEGIACILGTGANSCLYDGSRIVMNTSPMGYVLGDEGSGAVIGKTFVGELYKGCHRDFITVFETETGLTQADIIQCVYREPLPNRFLASLCPFVSKHISEQEWIASMVVDCFRLFFMRNVSHYNRPDLPVNFVGSIAFYFEKQLRQAAEAEGYKVGKIMKSPL